MGYLSQKKSKRRMDLLLSSLSTLSVLFVFASFFSDTIHPFIYELKTYFLHFYALAVVLMVFSFYFRYFAHGFIFLICLILSYFLISSSANLVSNAKVESGYVFDIVYQKKNGKSEVFTHEEPSKAGVIRLSPRFEANYRVITKNRTDFVLVNLSFAGIKEREARLVFNNLALFVEKQDDPVIIIGDFGLPAWMDVFKDFLVKTDLSVKNRIIPSDAKIEYDVLNPPTINLLAYKNVGIKEIKFMDKHVDVHYPILFELIIDVR